MPRKPTGNPTGRPAKQVSYFALEPFEFESFDQAKRGIDRAVMAMTAAQYRAFVDRLLEMGPELVEIVEIDEQGNPRKLKPDEYPYRKQRTDR